MQVDEKAREMSRLRSKRWKVWIEVADVIIQVDVKKGMT